MHALSVVGLAVCTGLWDVVTPERVCDILSKNVEGHKCDAQVVASELVKFALGRGSSDNVTVLALRFDHNRNNGNDTDADTYVPPTETAGSGEAVETPPANVVG